ncbi:MAG: hypothetical protein HYX63_06050 [Gammaproteobacteria bacterium]|nr:hypothetical protein [Gammaproteobacteria bacterium]
MKFNAGIRFVGILAMTLLSHSAMAGSLALPAGGYDITAQMVMPHLDEMRRIVTHEHYCIRDADPAALFPVLRQHALRGCKFGFEKETGTGIEYVLVCDTARVATGTVRLNRDSAHIVGAIDVKMGGKNMTFSQHIEASRQGNCAAE